MVKTAFDRDLQPVGYTGPDQDLTGVTGDLTGINRVFSS